MDYSNIILNFEAWKDVGISTGMVLVALVLGSFLHSFVFAVVVVAGSGRECLSRRR